MEIPYASDVIRSVVAPLLFDTLAAHSVVPYTIRLRNRNVADSVNVIVAV
uniref:Uncharacterized protein n=1 Tax=Peronospora matthiolae TaxID=2874970 RepID=A0AAV1U9U5_9STRA